MDTATLQMWRSSNAKNRYQGEWPRVLCVCSAGLLRSPTLAWVLSNAPYNCNTRAVGSHHEYALIPIDQVHLTWADHVVFVNRENHMRVEDMQLEITPKLWVLDIPDRYMCRDPELVQAIEQQLETAKFPHYERKAA